MKDKTTPTVRRALKTALFDVGSMVLYLALLAVAVVVLWWLAGSLVHIGITLERR